MNTQTAFEIRAFEQAQREALADALRLERAMNGPTPLELAKQRIAELESQRDEVYRDAAEWIRDLQEYFPGATGLHDVFKGIEKMESEREQFKHALGWLLNAPHRQDARDHALSLINNGDAA